MTTSNLKRYPKLVLTHDDVGRDYAKIPNSIILAENLEAVEFQTWCKLRWAIGKQYNNRSHLANLIGSDRSNLWKVMKRLEAKGYLSLVETGATIYVKTLMPSGQPTAELPTAKKEEKEEASPEQPQQPQSARKVDRPVKVNRGEDLPANAPSPEELAKNWNEAANNYGDAEYGYPIVQDDVAPADFTLAVIRTLMFHASTNDVEPISIMRSVVFRSNWFKGLNGKCPAYVIGTVTDNETINQRFYDSGTASQRRKEKREEAQWRQWEADAPLREAEAAREKSEREEYERKQQEFHDVLCAGYIRACEANGNQPDKVGFMEVITAKYPKAPRIADLGMAIMRRDVYLNSPLNGRVFVGDEKTIGSEARRKMTLEVAEKLSYALCALVPNGNVPSLRDLDSPFTDELDKILEARIS